MLKKNKKAKASENHQHGAKTATRKQRKQTTKNKTFLEPRGMVKILNIPDMSNRLKVKSLAWDPLSTSVK